ncbi:hypothetical protein [Streptomyces sp. MMS24-I29]|uniref:hypothetical protein n=1 Tax=Streptomyces sp. MMS24-I29 TaxID=3351480 RepID=UPI003C7C1DAA
MKAHRFTLIAAVLVASLTACNPSGTTTESDSKPSAPTATEASTGASAPVAPGAPADGLPLAEAIAKIPSAHENRTGYKRDSFRHWIDEDSNGATPTRKSCSPRRRRSPNRAPGVL